MANNGTATAEFPLLIHDWISADQNADISFDQFVSGDSYTTRSDLLRFLMLFGVDIR